MKLFQIISKNKIYEKRTYTKAKLKFKNREIQSRDRFRIALTSSFTLFTGLPLKVDRLIVSGDTGTRLFRAKVYSNLVTRIRGL